ncbi:hypothetical protein F385_3056 [Pantoea agglomerans 299R]|nr:hypothetical protein F385_3056 [Pantoea agglomerans 299R]
MCFFTSLTTSPANRARNADNLMCKSDNTLRALWFDESAWWG